jgi:hypothetical protein
MHNHHTAAWDHQNRALWLALESQVDAVAAEAAILRAFQLASIERRPQDALAQEPMAWALVRRVGGPPPLVALLHNNVGAAWDEAGELRRAIAAYEEGLAQAAEVRAWQAAPAR